MTGRHRYREYRQIQQSERGVCTELILGQGQFGKDLKRECSEFCVTLKILQHQHINSTATVIEVVLNDRGITLVRKALTQQNLDIGRLTQFFPEHRWPIDWKYYLICSPASIKRPEVKAFQEWMLKEVRGG